MLIQAVESYLEVRRACGFQLKCQANLLHSFAAFFDARSSSPLSADIAIEWAGLGKSPERRARRLGVVIRFARYIRAEDPRHELPPTVFGSETRTRPTPYILSPDEIRRLVQTASQSGYTTLRRETYATFFSLLACTGLRVSEAVNLRFDDITADGLVIRCSKFRKSRLVPVHDTALAGLATYLIHRRPYAPLDDHVFVSIRRKPLLLGDVASAFRSAVKAIGLQQGRGLPRATAHSLRHTFAVRALEACTTDRDHIRKHMVALSTYLGHTTVANTYWYLQATPALMQDIASISESFVLGDTAMNSIAPHITEFLQQRMVVERGASENTCESYAYAFKLLFEYASGQLHLSPSRLNFEQIDAPLVVGFLNHLETNRKNGPNSRNVRLAAIKSFMHFMEYRLPSGLEQIQRILAIPTKKADTRLVRHLTVEETQCILNAPVPTTRAGMRDRAMLHLCFAGGLRVSELIGLRLTDLTLQPHPSILVRGKGRKERCLPLWKETATALRAWLAVRGQAAVPELFLNAQMDSLTRAGFEYILDKHVRAAKGNCPSLSLKRVSPHVLRHTCALTILQATKDIRKVSLWLGHVHIQTTEMYTRADPSVKLEALEEIISPKLRSGRFKATDQLIASLDRRALMRREK